MVPGTGILASLRRDSVAHMAPNTSADSKFTARAAAVHALEEALAAEGSSPLFAALEQATKKRASTGRWIPKPSLEENHRSKINLDEVADGEEEHELPVTPITRVASVCQKNTYLYQTAVNDEFIAYGLKQGHIRVLHRFSEARALLKGHSGPVADVRLLSDANGKETILAAGGQDGRVYVWRMKAQDGENSIHAEQIVAATFSPGCDNALVRLSMATCEAKAILACAVANSVVVLPLPDAGEAGLELEIDPLNPELPALLMPNFPPQDKPTAVAIFKMKKNDFEECILAAGSKHGRMYTARIKNAGEALEALAKMEVTSDSEINQLLPIAVRDGAETTQFIVASCSNGVQQILLRASQDEDFELSRNHEILLESKWEDVPFILADVAEEKHLLVAVDSLRKAVYTFHLNRNGFDYFARFKVGVSVMNFCAHWDPDRADMDNGAVELTCIQADAVQQYVIDPALCWDESGALALEQKASSEKTEQRSENGRALSASESMKGGTSEALEPQSSTASIEPSQEECPSPPPSPSAPAVTVQVPVPLAIPGESSAAQASTMVGSTGSTPRLLTPKDLLKPSTAGSGSQRPSSGRATPAGPTIKVLKRPTEGRSGAVNPTRPETSPQIDEAGPGKATELAGADRKLVAHLSSMYKELLRAMKNEISTQAAAQQAANAALLREALTAQAIAVQNERSAVLAEERLRMEQLVTALSKTIKTEISVQLAETFRSEFAALGDNMSKALVPAMEGALATAIQKQAPNAIKSAVDKQLGGSLQASVTKSIQDSFRQTFTKQVVPSFEQACQTMFMQVDKAFTKGLQEHFARSQSMLSGPTALATQLKDSLEIAQSLASRSDGPGTAAFGNIRTPRSSAETRAELQNLISRKHYDQAFSLALGLQDIKTLSWLCSIVDAGTVLSGSTPLLSQMVLLSLIQQLSSDLTSNSTGKLQWIREAAMVINPKDPVLSAHLVPVLQQVHENLSAGLSHLQGADVSSCKLAMHVVHSQMTS